MQIIDTISKILAKTGLSYEDAQTLVGHFAREYLRDKCALNVQVELNSGSEKGYLNACTTVSISDKETEEVLLSESSSEYCYVG